jgi:hypothetical protein
VAAVTPDGWPSWVYHPTRPTVIVKSLIALNALPDRGNWSAIPYPENPPPWPHTASGLGSELEALTAVLRLVRARCQPA